MTWSSDWITPSSQPADDVATPAAWALEEISAGLARAYPEVVEEETRGVDEEAAALRQAELEEAYQRGLEEGYREATARAVEQVRSALAALDQAVTLVRNNERVWVEHARETICALAIAVAKHVIGRELKGDAHAVAELVRRALALYPIDEPLRVRVHPQDLSTLTMASTETGVSIAIAAGRDVRWIADAELSPGSCVVEGRHRVLDGRIDHALERIYQKLADA